MPQYGRYETVLELSRSGFGSVFIAHAKGSGRRFVIRTHEPDQQFFLNPSTVGGDAAQAFLSRAQLQRRMVAAGARHWATVIEAGRTDLGVAYAVTPYYPLTLARLIGSRTRFTAPMLSALVRTVVDGLRELRVHAGRAHGGIRPGNVLLEEGWTRSRKIYLNDLADIRPGVGAVAEAAVRADLISIGQIIHEAVLHAPPPRMAGVEVPATKAWHALGPSGFEWLALCNDLLNVDGDTFIPLDTLATRLAAMQPRKRRRTAGLGKAVLVVGLLGTATVYLYRYVTVRNWNVVHDAQGWAVPLTSQLDALAGPDPSHPASINQLLAVRSKGQSVDPQTIAPSAEPDRAPWAPHVALEVYRAGAEVREISSTIERMDRELPSQLDAAATSYEARGWSAAGEEIRRVRSALGPHPMLIDVLVKVQQSRLTELLSDIETRWSRIEPTIARVAAVQDPLLVKLSGITSSHLRDANVHELAHRLEHVERVMTAITAAVDHHLARADQERLHAEPVYAKSEPTLDDLEQWALRLPQHERRIPQPDLGPIHVRLEELRRAAQRISAADLVAQVQSLQLEAKSLDRPWQSEAERDRAVAAVERQVELLKDAIGDSELEHNVTSWLSSQRRLRFNESAVDEAWATWLSAQSFHLKRNPRALDDVRREAEARRTALERLSSIPVDMSDLPSPLVTAAKQRRDEHLSAAVADVMGEGTSASALADAVDRYEQHLRHDRQHLLALAETSERASMLMDAGQPPAMQDGLSAAANELESNPLADQAMVARWIEPIKTRMAELEDIEQSRDPAALEAAIRSERPELAVAAWHRMQAIGHDPDDAARRSMQRVLDRLPEQSRSLRETIQTKRSVALPPPPPPPPEATPPVAVVAPPVPSATTNPTEAAGTSEQATSQRAAELDQLLAEARQHAAKSEFPDARRKFEDAASAGSDQAQMELADMLYGRARLLWGTQAILQAQQIWQEAANHNKPWGWTGLGRYAFDREQFSDAVEQFRKGANAGDPEAMYRLYLVRFKSGISDVSVEEAQHWLNEATAHGHPQALRTKRLR